MKIHRVLVLFMMLFASYIYAADNDVITKVEVKGNFYNVKPGKILSATKLKKGKPYSIDAVREDVSAIASLDCVENVGFFYDKGILTFTVVEKRRIDTIIFKGNSKKFTAKKLEKTSSLKKGEYYDDSKFDETKEKILELYKDNGYSDCHIQGYPTDNLNTNKVTVTFLITENIQTTVGGVDIKGVTFFTKKKILGLMEKIKEEGAYSKEFFEEDKTKIEKFYKENGFVDYKLVSSSTYNEKKTKVFLTLNISEGSKYKIGKITYNGNLSVDDREIEKLIKLENEISNYNEIHKAERNIHELYVNRGYINAYIEHNYFNKDATKGTIDINFSIQENDPSYVGDINIYGLKCTQMSFIKRELLLKQGDLFERDKFIRSMYKLRNLGFIEVLDHQQTPVAGTDIVDLTLDVAELVPSDISLSLGIGGSKNIFGGVQFIHKNLFGRGQTATASVQFNNNKESAVTLDWQEPWLLDKNVILTMGGSHHREVRDIDNKSDAYRVETFGAKCEVGRRLGEYMSLLGGYSFDRVRFFDIKEEAKGTIDDYYGLQKPKDKINITSIIGTFVYNSLDYPVDPSTGNASSLTAGLASSFLGGDVNFLKLHVGTIWYFPIFWRFVLSVSMGGWTVTSLKDNERVPLNETFNSTEFVRGYEDKNEIGPKSGGSIKGLTSVECKFPIFPFEQGERARLQGIVFSDIGGIWNGWKDVSLKIGSKNDNLHASLGIGLRIIIPPLGVFRFDGAFGFNRNSKKRGLVFHFSNR